MRFPGFIGPSYLHQSKNVDAQTCVNLYPEVHPLGTGKEREVASLLSTPGLQLRVTLDNAPVRGLITASNGTLFAVGGEKLFSINSSWVATELGSLNTFQGFVSMADNGSYLFITDGTNGYTLNLSTSAFAVVTDGDYYASDLVTFLDGYFLFNRTGTGQFFFSGLNDITFDATDIATVEGSPDDLVGLITLKQYVYMFGTRSVEVFYNTGDADNTFQRVQGARLEVGCASAPHTIQKLLDTIYWLGGDDNGDGIIYRMNGFQYDRISTPSIEAIIRDIDKTLLSQARAWTYQQGGHGFYCINLPGVKRTWCFDTSTGYWHERTYKGVNETERHRVDCHAVFNGKNVVGDYETGAVYTLEPEVYTDNGQEIIRERTAPHVSQGLKRIFHHSLQIDMETGVGLTSGQGSDPQVMLDYSDDGGHSWSNERWASAGKIGQRLARVKFNRLGSSRDRVYRVRISDPVKVALIGAELEVTSGVS